MEVKHERSSNEKDLRRFPGGKAISQSCVKSAQVHKQVKRTPHSRSSYKCPSTDRINRGFGWRGFQRTRWQPRLSLVYTTSCMSVSQVDLFINRSKPYAPVMEKRVLISAALNVFSVRAHEHHLSIFSMTSGWAVNHFNDLSVCVRAIHLLWHGGTRLRRVDSSAEMR